MVRGNYIKKQPFNEGSLRNPRINRVLVCEDLNFLWDEPELEELKKMWNLTLSVQYMAKHFDRDEDEVVIALIHLAREDKIKQRKGGLLGEFRKIARNAENIG